MALLAMGVALWKQPAGTADPQSASKASKGDAAASARRAAAMRALHGGQSPRPASDAEAALLARLPEAPPREQLRILQQLGRTGSPAAVPSIAGLVDGRNVDVSVAAINALGALGGEDADGFLMAYVDDPGARFRELAFAALGKSGSDEALRFLTDVAMNEGRTDARLWALDALAQSGQGQVIAPLLQVAQLATNPMRVRVSAVSQLGALELPEAGQALRKLVKHPEAEIRRAALDHLSADDPETQKVMLGLLDSPDYRDRVSAAAALGRGHATLAIAKLEQHADEQAYGLGSTCISALGDMDAPEAEKALGRLMARTGWVALAAANTLVQGGDEHAVGLVIAAIATARGNDRQLLLQAVMGRREDSVLAFFRELVHNGSAWERGMALAQLMAADAPDAVAMAEQLARSGPPASVSMAIETLANSESPEAQAALLALAYELEGGARRQVLARLVPDSPEVIAMLSEVARSSNTADAVAAIQSLARSEAGQVALVAALADSRPEVAMSAINGLRGVGSPEARAALLGAMHSPNEQVRVAALCVLVQDSAPEAERVLRDALHEKEGSNVYRVAVNLLNSYEGPGADALLAELTRSKDPETRMVALSVLARHGSPLALDAARGVMNDPQSRDAVLYGLAASGNPQALGAVIDAARSGSKDARVAALRALSGSDDPRVQDVARSELDSSDDGLAMAAIDAVASGGSDSSIDAILLARLHDQRTSEAIRGAAARALRNRGASVSDADDQLMTDLGAGDDAYFGGGMYGDYYPNEGMEYGE